VNTLSDSSSNGTTNPPPSQSYYGRPIVKPHVWRPYIPWYFWIGGAAGAAAVECVCARMRGAHRLATVEKRAALAGVLIAPVLLIADLGVPGRFVNMLRVVKLTSPMNMGTWILTAFGGAIAGSTFAEILGWQRTSRTLEVVAAGIGPALTTYTAVLIADTATPVWHAAGDTLPFVFAASGVASAGAIGVAFTPREESSSARRLMIGGAIGLLIAGGTMETRLGPLLAEPYRTGKAGEFRSTSMVLSLAGIAFGTLGRKNQTATRIAAACIAGACILERFAVTTAGKQSALDPKYTVEPQRARLDQARAGSGAGRKPDDERESGMTFLEDPAT
jgi:hypothetical protein